MTMTTTAATKPATPRARAASPGLFVGQSTTGAGLPEPDYPDDFVCDVVRIVADVVAGLSEEQKRAVNEAVRERWGGDRPYIARRLGEGRSERNAAIRRDHQRGESIALLCRRYDLCRRQVLRVLGLG